MYEGMWAEGKKHGQGKQTSRDKRVAEGEWSEGKLYNGSGALVRFDGSVCEGTWVNGVLK